VNNYVQPTSSDLWEVEAGGPDIITYDENNSKLFSPSYCTFDVKTYSNRTATLKSSILSSSKVDSHTLINGWDAWEQSGFKGTAHFMEICGGLAMRRKGIQEVELLDLLNSCLLLNGYKEQWDVVRAWVECGYFNRLQYKRWRRTEYYPVVPRIVLDYREGFFRGVLFGLATKALRDRVDIMLSEHGCKRERVVSQSQWIVPLPSWRAESVDSFIRVSTELGLKNPVWLKSLMETGWPLSQIMDRCDDPPKNYECWGRWDWEQGRFSRNLLSSGDGVEIIRKCRPDRVPYYEVMVDGESIWWSTSRNWALIIAHDLNKKSCFAIAGETEIVRTTKAQVYLPLSVGLYLTLKGNTVPGKPDGKGGYVYYFNETKDRAQFISWFFGLTTGLDSKQEAQWAYWILSLSKRVDISCNEKAIPLPYYIRQKLEYLGPLPGFRELSQSKIPPSLLPRIMNGLLKFSKLREV